MKTTRLHPHPVSWAVLQSVAFVGHLVKLAVVLLFALAFLATCLIYLAQLPSS